MLHQDVQLLLALGVLVLFQNLTLIQQNPKLSDTPSTFYDQTTFTFFRVRLN